MLRYADQPDLVIRNGTIIDGLGGPPVEGDIAIREGRIAAVGTIHAKGVEEFDAQGAIVTPGFVDLHTHYDGQAIWSSRLIPSSAHGVTTVLAGNCGVGFAPCRAADRERLVSVMEGVEDIPEVVMTAGLTWEWESFPEFLQAVERRPHDINIGFYLPHSALRVFVMGERGARREPATPDDLAAMQQLVQEALIAGAIGFATSNVPIHRTGAGEFIPSYAAAEAEYMAVARAMMATGRGVFQMVADFRQPGGAGVVIPMMARISQASGRTVTFSLVQQDTHPNQWREILDLVTIANRQPGVRISPQVFPRPVGILLGLELTLNPFSLCPSYKEIEHLPLDARLAALRQPAIRARLLTEQAEDPTFPLFKICRNFSRIFPLAELDYEPDLSLSLASQARSLGIPPEEVAYDYLVQQEGKALLFATLTNYADGTLDPTFEMMNHPDTIIALGDGGAHYGLICDASYPTFVLTHWARDRRGPRMALVTAIKALSHDPARAIGLDDRGAIAPGLRADINVIDFNALHLELPQPLYDLPSGGRRISQKATGYRAIFVGGVMITHHGEPTGALPGQIIRGECRERIAS